MFHLTIPSSHEHHSVRLYQNKRSTISLNIILGEHHHIHSLFLTKILSGILMAKILFSYVHENNWSVHLLNTHIIMLNSMIINQCMLHKWPTLYEWRVYSSYSRIANILKLISLICHIKKINKNLCGYFNEFREHSW